MSNLTSLKDSNPIKYYKYIFFLFPFFLVTGPFIPDLIISLLSLIFFLLLIKTVNKKLFINNLFYFFLFFYFYIILNSFFSFDPIISLKSSFPYIRMIFFSFFLAYLLGKIDVLCKIILFSLIICYVLLLADSLYQFVTGFNILGYKSTDRISSFFGEKLIMGSFVSRTLPVALSILFFVKIRFNELCKVFIIFISGVLIYFSAERLAFAYYLFTVIFFILINLRKKKILITTLLILLFTFLTLFHFKPNSFDRLFFHTVKQSKQTSYYGFSYRHELHFLTAFNLFNDSKLLGHGLKSFRYLCGLKNYAPTEKIILDNTISSTVEGHFFLLNDLSQKYNFLIIEKNFDKNKLAKIISEPSSVESILFRKLDDGSYFRKLDEGLYNYRFSDAFNGIYIKHNDFVSKGQKLGFTYEFLNGCNTHPHNIYLEFISELGLLGLMFLLVGFFYILYNIFITLKNLYLKKNINSNGAFLFSLIGIFMSIFPLFPSGSFFNNWLSSIFYFNVAFLIFFRKKIND
jgi:O-antigen ligase